MTEITTRPVPQAPPSPPPRPPARKRGLLDHSLVQLTLVRYKEFVREPEAVFWVFVFPILLAAGLGVAFRNRPAGKQQVAVVSSAPGASSVAAALGRDSSLAVQLLDDSAAALALRTGKVAIVVQPHGADSVTYRYDDTRSDALSARLITDDALQRASGRQDPVGVNESHVRERGSRYIDFVIPGLLGMNLMGSGIWGLGFAIVDARRKKLLKRLIATPMPRAQFLLSFLLSRLTWLMFEVITLLGFGVLVFGVPMRGSLASLALICLVGALSFGAMGLLIASRAKTVEGASGLMNLVMMPMWVFSGVFFSAANFPKTMQPFIQALPLTAVNDALRANMLQGASLASVSGEIAIALAWLVVCFVVALKLFRWR
ncbi:MAG TPA: ABC transporter permease [Gemmatimonadaceae bacterium]